MLQIFARDCQFSYLCLRFCSGDLGFWPGDLGLWPGVVDLRSSIGATVQARDPD